MVEHQGLIVSAGLLEPVSDTDFGGIWGGATLKEWRCQGIYPALTSARARAAMALDKRFIHSDSTEYSRPIWNGALILAGVVVVAARRISPLIGHLMALSGLAYLAQGWIIGAEGFLASPRRTAFPRYRELS